MAAIAVIDPAFERPHERRGCEATLRVMAAEGDAIVLLSSDTPELAHLCDHIMALHNGGFAEILTHAKTTEETIVAMPAPTPLAGALT